MDAHAQLEIRSYAKIIGEEIVKAWCPMAWEAFLDYKLNGESFSQKELEILALTQAIKDINVVKEKLLQIGFYIKNDFSKPSRELLEFENKLTKYQFNIPWK
jgi:thymidylate synthase (FAD)